MTPEKNKQFKTNYYPGIENKYIFTTHFKSKIMEKKLKQLGNVAVMLSAGNIFLIIPSWMDGKKYTQWLIENRDKLEKVKEEFSVK